MNQLGAVQAPDRRECRECAAGRSGPRPRSCRAGGWVLALVLAAAPLGAQGTSFYTVPPCRVVDTRGAAGPLGAPALTAGVNRAFAVGGQCGISTRAVAVAANVTVVNPQSPGFLAFAAVGGPIPPTSTINFSPGQVRANNAILALGTAGGVESVPALGAGTVDVVVDVGGYFADPALEQTTTAPPAFNPPPGSYSGSQQVSLVSSTPGAQIFYTTDGSMPSSSHGTLYSAPVALTQVATTLQAIAVAGGLADSPVTSGQYSLTLAPTLLLAQMTPQNGSLSLGSGSASLLLAGDQATAVLRFSYANLTGPIVAEHIHGPGGVILFDIDTSTPDSTGGRLWTLVPAGTLDVAAIRAALFAGQCYINLHTAAYPAGEIRGYFNVATGSATFTPPPPPPALPPPPVTQTDAARFLMQASYGPTAPGEVTNLSTDPQGFLPWLAGQYGQPLVSHLAYIDAARTAGETISANQVMESFWKQALTGPDQLRQRLALALSEIMVISDQNSEVAPDGMAHYLDVLENDAFGNFRQLLEDVTLDPAMGTYLNMLANDEGNPAAGINPNENYARELMQLFSIGLYWLNPDGTLMLDASGLPLPTYDQNAVMGLAQVFTGWTFAGGDHSHTHNFFYVKPNWRQPMEAWPDHHSPGTKTLLEGVTVPAGQTPQQDLDQALNLIFDHPNVGPFICRQLIQRLVTSNPSPAYVYRCGQAFANNGAGVRGDMKAVVNAILFDYEARSTTFIPQQGYGRLREPIVRLGGLMRAIYSTPQTADGEFRIWHLEDGARRLDQNPLRSPTVFNFFSPSFVLPGTVAQAGLVAPEFQITSEETVFGVAHYFSLVIYSGVDNSVPGYSTLIGLADADLVGYLNLVLMANQMSPQMQSILMTALANPSFSNPHDATVRVKNLVHLIVLSPEYVVQR
jgi:uncharacterized protein (DUF1800 family)